MAEKPKDLNPNEFPKIVWEQGKFAEPLEQLFTCVVKEANDAIAWYTIRRKPKQYGGQILRVSALIFAAVAGLVPIFGEIFQDNEHRPGLAPAWATVALGIAGLLVLLDRFWGFTKIKETGSIIVKVTNGSQCESGWRLTIDDGPEASYSGITATLAKIQPGIRTIRVVGTVNGVEKRGEKSVSVPSGGAENIELTLV